MVATVKHANNGLIIFNRFVLRITNKIYNLFFKLVTEHLMGHPMWHLIWHLVKWPYSLVWKVIIESAIPWFVMRKNTVANRKNTTYKTSECE